METKKILTASAIGLAAMGSVQTAKADEIHNQPNETESQVKQTQEVSPIERAQQKVDDSQKQVNQKQTEVNDAQTKVDQTQSDLDQTKQEHFETVEKVQQASGELDQAQQDYQKAQETAKSATPENIQSTKDDITNTQQQIQDQQTTVDQTQFDLNDSQKVVDEKQSVVDDAQAKTDQAQAEVDQAQSIVDNSSAKDAQDKVDQAQSGLNKAQQEKQNVEQQISNTEQQIKSDQSNVQDKQTALDQTQSDLNTASDRANQAKSNLDNANTAAKNQQDKVNDLQTKVDSLEEQTKNMPVVPKMPEQAMKEILANNVSKETEKMLQDMFMDPKTYIINKDYLYHGPESDKSRPVDYANLTYDQAKELTLFTADLVNQYRLAAGLPPVKVNEASILYAMEIGKKANVKTYHDTKVNNKVMEEHNVHTYENLHASYGSAQLGNLNNMYGIKKATYQGITGMMFNDGPSNWGHAYTILSSHKNSSIEVPSNTFLGVSTDKFGNVHYEYIYPITNYKNNLAHLNTTEDQFSQKDLIAIPDNAAIIKEYNNQKSKLANEKAILNDFNSVSEKAEKLYKAQLNTQKDAQDKVIQAQNDLDKAKTQLESSQSTLAQLKQVLQDATDKVTLAKGILSQAEVALENVNADVKTKLDNLNKAKAKLQDVQSKLDQAKSDLTQAAKVNDGKKADLENQISKLNDLKNILAKQQQLLEDYKNAGINLENAKQNYLAKFDAHEAATKDLAGKDAELQKAVDAHEAAKKAADKVNNELIQLQNGLDQAKSNYDKLIKEQNEKEQQRIAQEKELQRVENQMTAQDNGYHVDNGKVVDKSGNVVQDWAAKGDTLVDPNGNEFVVENGIVKDASVKKDADEKVQTTDSKQNDVQADVQAKQTETKFAEEKPSATPLTFATRAEARKAGLYDTKSTELPQTGDNKTTDGLIAAGLVSILTAFGLAKSTKRRKA